MAPDTLTIERRTVDDLVNKGALHFQMETPRDSIYETGPLSDKLSQAFLANLNLYDDIRDAEALSRIVPTLIREMVQNAIEHGNGIRSSKPIDGYFLWEDDRSGNLLMYVAVKDRGKGFDVDRYTVKNRKWGGEAIPWLKEVMDYVYSIDSVVYAAKVMVRANAQPVRIDKAA